MILLRSSLQTVNNANSTPWLFKTKLYQLFTEHLCAHRAIHSDWNWMALMRNSLKARLLIDRNTNTVMMGARIRNSPHMQIFLQCGMT